MYLWTLFILCAFVRNAQTSVVLNAADVGQLEGSEDLLMQAVAKYFSSGDTLGLFLSWHVQMEKLVINMSVPVYLFTTNNNNVDCHSQILDLQGYILVASCKSSLENQILPALHCFNQSSFRLRSKRILILDVCFGRDSYDSNRYFSYLEFIWKNHGLIHVSILPLCKISKGNIKNRVFTYNPFNTGNAFRSGLVEAEVDGDFVTTFQQRFKNMNGYKIKALDIYSSSASRGFERSSDSLRKAIQKFFNVTIEVTAGPGFNFSEMDKNSSYLINYGIDSLEDLWLNEVSLEDCNLSTKIHCLNSYYTDPIVVVVTNQPISTWEMVLYAFTKELWFWIALSYMLICVCAVVFSKYHISEDKSSLGFRMSSDLSRVCNALLTRPISKLPTRNSERMLMALSWWVGFVVTTILLGQIIRFMYSIPELPGVSTYEELNKSGLNVKNVSSVYLTDKRIPTNCSLGKEFEAESICSDGRVKVTRMLDSLTGFVDSSSIRGVRKLRGHEFFLPFGYIVPAGSVLIEQLNNFLSKLSQSGVAVLWRSRLVENILSMVQNGKVQVLDSCRTQGKSYKELSYGDLKLAFYSLYVGLTLSVVCFVIEVLTKKYQFG